MLVCVLNKKGKPVHMCHQANARKLLSSKQAVVIKTSPMVIRLKKEIDDVNNIYFYEERIDPGSKTTGVAIVKNNRDVVALGEIHHKKGISESLDSRKSLRRGRRNRKTRYRHCKWAKIIPLATRYTQTPKALRAKKGIKKPSFGSTRQKGKIAPSLQARVTQIINHLQKMRRFIPIQSVGLELVKFDFQQFTNGDIQGVEYQQGTLQGYTVREYLLEKWERKCSYCHEEDVALEIEHIHPKSKGGSNRIDNLCLACRTCNEEKGNLLLSEWINSISTKKGKRFDTISKNAPLVLEKRLESLRDASAVNTTRWALFNELKKLGVTVTTQSGAKTKMQRIQQSLPKEHYYDALCIYKENVVFQWKTNDVMEFHAKGRGNRQMARVNKYGFPKGHRERKKTCEGFQTGDMVLANVPGGKKQGIHKGRVAIRHTGYFNITTREGVVQGISVKHCCLIQRNDGWQVLQRKRTAKVI